VEVGWRDYIDTRLEAVEHKVDSLNMLMRREFELLAQDRDRQRADLAHRLEGMNALRAQLDRQAGTFATRERVELMERQVWRAIGLLAGLVIAAQVLIGVLLR